MKAIALAAGVVGLAMNTNNDKVENFMYRDDIGAFWGIKGYEEMVTEVGTHKGHMTWP
jgi:ubiquinol-cytochrome c reductase cytochrome c1 subunit